ncbi:hypothetical protein NECAME_15005 [Necator americanus]|uniref:ATPase AAA-type core domain-containing protein n=1 Tax=Necator americanus TaxID=51031 RepID=W2SMJ5_NECAM|nr:hypothetical protein NECAME_15005 [Necator americanus]ETN69937.1 hypothetical protein NECAME_15005 [Necator americanus]
MESYFWMSSIKYDHPAIQYIRWGIVINHTANSYRIVLTTQYLGVQQALLKLVEGTVAKVKLPGHMGNKVDVDTTNILFVASGAFSNVEQIVARRIDKR